MQMLKKISYIFLSSLTLFSDVQASKSSFEDLGDHLIVGKVSISKREPELSHREMRLRLFDLDKFDSSFELEANVLAQMKNRTAIWNKPKFSHHIEDEIIGYFPNQSKIIDYIPYYLKEILDIKSANDLRFKKEFFSDFIKLTNVVYKSLNGKEIKKLEEEILKVNLKEYPLFPIFLRFFAFQQGKVDYSRCSSIIEEKIKDIYIDEDFDKSHKYHKSLGEKCKIDQEKLEELSNLELFSVARLKSLLFLHNFINN